MIKIEEYLDELGRSPYGRWFNKLGAEAAAKVAVVLVRMAHGNLSNIKGVGGGVHEYRLDYGPGYRIYFGKDGNKLIILLAGGTKKRQQTDIEAAQAHWADYKRRKKKGM